MFTLHPRLEQDSLLLGRLPLCQIRLLNDQQYPWLLLIPVRPNITEIHQLSSIEQHQLIEESSIIAQLMDDELQPDKINVGALGNVVPQLHWHVIARSQQDAAWPGPVWGAHPTKPYQQELKTVIATWHQRLEKLEGFVHQ